MNPSTKTEIWSKKPSTWWFGTALFLFVVGIVLNQISFGEDILFFARHRNSFLNYFFRATTLLGEAHIYVILFFVFLFIKYRYALLMPILGGLVILAVTITKKYFCQLRPYEYFDDIAALAQAEKVPDVILHSGDTSMPSGHTMSAFALCALLSFLFSYHKKGLSALLFLVATLVGISRMYLMQHFLKDVYCGALIGIVIGVLVYLIQTKWSDEPSHWWNNKLSLTQ